MNNILIILGNPTAFSRRKKEQREESFSLAYWLSLPGFRGMQITESEHRWPCGSFNHGALVCRELNKPQNLSLLYIFNFAGIILKHLSVASKT